MKHQKWQCKIWATLKKYKFNIIFVRNFLVTMFMMTLPLLCIVTIIQSYVNVIVEKEILETNRKSLERTAETINSVVDQVFSFSYYLARSEELVLLGLMSYEELQEEYLNYIEKNVHAYVKIQEYIDSVYIYMERQGCVISYSRSEMVAGKVELLSDKEDSAWLEEYLNMGNRVYTIKSRQKKGHYPYLLSVITSIQNCEKGAKGAIVVNINMKELGKVLGHQINDEQMFFMLDHNGNICYTNQVAFIDNDTKEYVYSDFLWGAEGVYEIDGKQY